MATIYKRRGKANRHGNYYASWIDHTGKRRVKCTFTTEYAVAQRIAAKLESDAALRREGVVDAQQESFSTEARRPLASHIDAYESKLEASGRSEVHVTETCKAIRKIADVCAFKLLSDLQADPVNAYAAGLATSGRSARTIQKHLTAIKSFTKWLATTGKLPRDPLASVQKPSPKNDRRHERRMLLPEEWHALQTSIADLGAVREGMPAPERVLLYATAIQTGLRSAELRSLTPSRLYLNGPQPFVTCGAGSTKNRKEARQYIQIDLADAIRQHVASREASQPVFTMPHAAHVSRMILKDIRAARDTWINDAADSAEYGQRAGGSFLAAVDHDGRRLDFHALRHTCGSWLAMAGAHPNAVKAVMRHSTIVLTMDAYGHLFPGQEADTIALLPEMMAARSATRSKRGAIPCVPVASGCENPADSEPEPRKKKPFNKGRNAKSRVALRRVANKGGARIRTGGDGFAIRCLRPLGYAADACF